MASFACLLIISVCLRPASGACDKKLPTTNGTINYNGFKVETCSWELPGDEFFNNHTLILKLVKINLRDGDCLGILTIPGHGGECTQEPRTCYGYSNNEPICADEKTVKDYEGCDNLYWRCSNKGKLANNDRKITIDSTISQSKSFNFTFKYFETAEKPALPAETTHATTMSATYNIQSVATDTTEKTTTASPVTMSRSDKIGATTTSATSTIQSVATDTTEKRTAIYPTTKSRSDKAGAATTKRGDRAPTASESQVQGNNIPIAVIVVPTVLGVLLVIILLVIIWWRRRLKKRREPDLPVVHHLPDVQDEEAPAIQHPEDDPYNYLQETPAVTSQSSNMLYAELATSGTRRDRENEPHDDTYDHLSPGQSTEKNTAGSVRENEPPDDTYDHLSPGQSREENTAGGVRENESPDDTYDHLSPGQSTEKNTAGSVRENEPPDDTYDHLSPGQSTEENAAGPADFSDVYAVVNKPNRQ